MALGMPIGADSSFVGQVTAHTGHYRWLIICGFGVWTIAQGLQSTIDKYTPVGKICGLLLMGGVASGFTFQTYVTAHPDRMCF